MKCPKCGYQSFSDLTACKKCGRDLTEIQAKFNFGGPTSVSVPVEEPPLEEFHVEQPADSSEESLPPLPAEAQPPEPEEQDDEHLLEDFFQNIDAPAEDELPTAAPPASRQPTSTPKKERVSASQVAEDFSKWQQEAPQSNFPFDELDADIDALRLSAASAEQAGEEGSPFDDVDALVLDWQLPADGQAPSEPVAAGTDSAADVPKPFAGEQPGMELSLEAETDERLQEQPAEPEPLFERSETPVAIETAEDDADVEEWSLPEMDLAAEPETDERLQEQPAEPEPLFERSETPVAIETAKDGAEEEEWSLPEMDLPAEPETDERLQELSPEPEPLFEQSETPVANATAEDDADEEEWPLPKQSAEHPADENFSLAEPCPEEAPEQEADIVAAEPVSVEEEIEPAAEEPLPETIDPQEEIGEQVELPLAARTDDILAGRAEIASVFLPGAEQDPFAAGARLLARRAKAYLTDLALLGAIFALFVCAGEIARLPAAGERFHFTGDVVLDLAAPYFLVFFSLCFGYFTFFHYLSGQTPGKMLFDVRVEGDEHAAITLAQAFLRCVGGLASLLPVGLGYLSIVLDGEQRGWNDRLAGSRVVMMEDED